jgi:fluoroacetyl-CoA thioesterase
MSVGPAPFPAVPVGLEHTLAVAVSRELSADALGNPGVRAYATPMLVLGVEQAAVAAITPYLDEGFISLGTHIDLRHLAPTPVGSDARIHVRLEAVEGRRLRFSVVAEDGIERIAVGDHERYLARTADFLYRLERKAARLSRL